MDSHSSNNPTLEYESTNFDALAGDNDPNEAILTGENVSGKVTWSISNYGGSCAEDADADACDAVVADEEGVLPDIASNFYTYLADNSAILT